jgi:hypothetical protein
VSHHQPEPAQAVQARPSDSGRTGGPIMPPLMPPSQPAWKEQANPPAPAAGEKPEES